MKHQKYKIWHSNILKWHTTWITLSHEMLKIHLRFYHNISQKHTCWHRIVFTIYHKITTSALSMLKTFHCNHRATTKRQIQNQKQCGHTQKKNIPYGGSVMFRNCRTNSKFLFWGRKNVPDDVSTAKWPNSGVENLCSGVYGTPLRFGISNKALLKNTFQIKSSRIEH